MITRRRIVFGLGATALGWPFAAYPQRQKPVIGYLANDPDRSSPTFRAFEDALRELGWSEDKDNIVIRYETSEGRDDRFPALAEKVVRNGANIIVTTGSPSTRAAKAATSTIPIVFGSAANPVEQKFVASLARPGGNVTGLALLVQELGPKRLQLMKEALPHATRFARFYQSTSLKPIQPKIIKEDEAAARALGVSLQQTAVTDLEDIAPAFAAAVRDRIDAVEVTAASVFVVNRKLVASLALKHGLPLMGPDGRFAEAGALLSYGENFAARYRRAAFLVDKILRGSKPADIPVEQPAIFELVANLKTASALGIALPDLFMVQVERVVK